MKKYVKSSILFSLLFFFECNGYAQNKEVILYKDVLFFNSQLFPRQFDHEPKLINDYGFAIAYNKRKDESKFRQYEVKFRTNKSTEVDNEFKRNEVQIIHRRGKYLNKKIWNVLQARYGGNVNLHYSSEDIDSKQFVNFPTDNYFIGIELSFFTGIEYRISDKLNIHLDLQLLGLNFSFLNSYQDNPALTEPQKEQSGFDIDLFGERVLKIGIGYVF